ncbi:ORF61 (o129) [Yersinia enterocolitica]|nr:ORF61 (o129) [Yersinia enterocolitica subsp. enterocolitica WA-314]CFQ21365.1 ORF61 (o129) [Yersinia enterocolitica]CNF79520.1 ORF61 (o129) [Yersinia enterocolitica]CNK33004.1 ORF61 (o129) [Yersinia enterocolitica]CRY27695.1 ORF61 (o129) [Yersinia enterocolitica]
MKVWGIFPRRHTENSQKTLNRFVSDNGEWTYKIQPIGGITEILNGGLLTGGDLTWQDISINRLYY